MRNFTEPEKTVIILLFFISCLFFFWSINYYFVNAQAIDTSIFSEIKNPILYQDEKAYQDLITMYPTKVKIFTDSYGQIFYSVDCLGTTCISPYDKISQ